MVIFCSLLMLLVVRAAAWAPPPAAEADSAVPAALDADDVCVGGRNGSECAFSALQLRAGLEQQQRQRPAQDVHSVIDLELFRPMAHGDLSQEFSNVDMFSLAGALHHLHTRAVWEHADDWAGTAEPRTDSRADSIDIVSRVNTRVRNPNSVIEDVGAIDGFVDFGAPAFFVDGMATGPGYNWDFGDVVGALRLDDPGFPTVDPFYQFSLSGYCPNLPTKLKRGAHSSKSGTCMKYSDGPEFPTGEVLRGGLCPDGDKPGAVPTGRAGCVYTYTPPRRDTDVVVLDELVGITKEDCGGRNCKNWKDWRKHCTNSRYKVKFNYLEGSGRRRRGHRHSLAQIAASGGSTLVKSHLCVEYDIHKDCAKDCGSPACQRLPTHLRDIGLPFWRGRCDPVRNVRRAEQLAEALGLSEAKKSHRLLRTQNNQSCLSADRDAMCNPDPRAGTGYCSREWAGVCQPCYIPNALDADPWSMDVPTCPWDIFTREGSDYADPALHVQCKSDLPREYCCLYKGTCNSKIIADARNFTKKATEDGFAYSTSLQSTRVMMSYLWRGVEDMFEFSIYGTGGFDELAYWQWARRPLPEVSLKKAMKRVANHRKQHGEGQ